MSALHLVPEAERATAPSLLSQIPEARAGLDWVATQLSGHLTDRWPSSTGSR